MLYSNFKVVSRIKFGLTLLGAAICAFGLTIYHIASERAWAGERAYEEILLTSAELHAEIGYGGMVHDFKNYVLRQGDSYRRDAIRHYEAAKRLIRRMRIDLPEAVAPALESVDATLDSYRKNLDLARAAIRRGESPREIDRLVKIDDTQANLALLHAMRQVVDGIERRRDALRLEQTMILTAVFISEAACLILLGGMIRYTARMEADEAGEA